MAKNKAVCIVNEFQNGSALQEVEVKQLGGGTFKIRGNSVLQTINEINNNRRRYSTALCEQFVETANKKIRQGKMLGEMDHPMVGDMKNPAEMRRQLTVTYRDASHSFPHMEIQNNKIIGVVESLSNANGMDLARMAAYDNISIGFSCRAVGKVRPIPGMQNCLEVVQPAIYVTHDAVTTPSHEAAVLQDITDILTDTRGLTKMRMVTEGSGDVVLNEADALCALADVLLSDVSAEHMNSLVEGFVYDYTADIPTGTKTARMTARMNMMLQEFLDTSDRLTGVSTVKALNESNIRSFLDDFSENHRAYQSPKSFMHAFKKFLG